MPEHRPQDPKLRMVDQTPNGTYQTGLTKRELFAAMAMQGMLSQDGTCNVHTIADFAVCQADALLARLAK